MQSTQLKQLLGKQASVLRAAGSVSVCDALDRLAIAIGRGDTLAAGKLLSAVENVGPPMGKAEGPLLGSITDTLREFVGLFSEAGVKKSIVTDVELVLDLTRRYGDVSISEFESAVGCVVASASRGKSKSGATPVDTNELVEGYLEKLQAALGNERMFRNVFRELSADKLADRNAVVAIASRFFEPTAASTSRPKALQKVLRRHEKLMESRGASSTIGGKAA